MRMQPSILAPGAPAPDFQLPRDGGGTLRLSDLRGRPVVLYFYPKDDTTACTAEAIDFSALAGRFARAGVAIVGVSPDSPKKHDKFKAKHGLSVDLVSDEEHAALEAYGVWGEKTMFGRKYMGVIRTTFLIDADGRIARVWPRVSVAGHAEEVLQAAKELKAAKG
jgi:peroxiredoxin Q/BCP